jgi:hypothetical protein
MLVIVWYATAELMTALAGDWRPLGVPLRPLGSSTVAAAAPKNEAYCAVKMGGKSSHPSGVSRYGILMCAVSADVFSVTIAPVVTLRYVLPGIAAATTSFSTLRASA